MTPTISESNQKQVEPSTNKLTRAELRQALWTALDLEISRLRAQLEHSETKNAGTEQKIEYLQGMLNNMRANANWKGPRLMKRHETETGEELK